MTMLPGNCTRTALIAGSVTLGVAAGSLTVLARHVRREIQRRGFPSWEECQCELKTQQTVFQVWHSHHEQRGETTVTHEWGVYLTHPAQWQRRLLHHSAQVLATLNPFRHYVEHIALRPQEARQYTTLLHTGSSTEIQPEERAGDDTPESYVVWRSEVLHFPRYLFDACVRRLYPAHIARERLPQAQALPAIWDSQSNIPLPLDGPLQNTPLGTRVDYIGWTPAQISYCTARLKPEL
jgi:hypothetical protein